MNRMREYEDLMAELAETPPELEFTVERALSRERSLHKKRRIFGVPAGSLAACFAGFVLLVNLFPPFAAACGNIPVLRDLAEAVSEELERQLKRLPREEIARASIDNNGKIIVADDLHTAIEIANEIAPEHLEICVDNPFDYLEEIRHAGSVFLGKFRDSHL